MGDQARCNLQQITTPKLHDLLAFLAQTTTLQLERFPRCAQHSSVIFERGAYHVRLELSPCGVVETWILVAQTNHAEEPTFPCFNVLTGTISRESYRSLMSNLLPDSEDGPVLDLLPTVNCRYSIKPALLDKPIAAEVAPFRLCHYPNARPFCPTTLSNQLLSSKLRL